MLTFRGIKGSQLTWDELDDNFRYPYTWNINNTFKQGMLVYSTGAFYECLEDIDLPGIVDITDDTKWRPIGGDGGDFIPITGTIPGKEISGRLVTENLELVTLGRTFTDTGSSEGSWFQVQHGGGSGSIGMFSKGTGLGYTAGISFDYTGVNLIDSYRTTITARDQVKIFSNAQDLWLSAANSDILMFGKNLKLPGHTTGDRAGSDSFIGYNTITQQFEGQRAGSWKNFLMDQDVPGYSDFGNYKGFKTVGTLGSFGLTTFTFNSGTYYNNSNNLVTYPTSTITPNWSVSIGGIASVSHCYLDLSDGLIKSYAGILSPSQRVGKLSIIILNSLNGSIVNGGTLELDLCQTLLEEVKSLEYYQKIKRGLEVAGKGDTSLASNTGLFRNMNSGYFIDSTNKNWYPAIAQTTISFYPMNRNGVESSTPINSLTSLVGGDIFANYYDNNGTLTLLSSNTKWQNLRIYSFFDIANNNVPQFIIQRGQTQYDSKTDAINGITTENFIANPFVERAYLLAVISVKRNLTATNLDTQCVIHNTGSHCELGGGGGGAIDLSTLVQKSGDTMTGFLTLHADPISAMHAATKNYVDNSIQGLKFKVDCAAASTTNINISSAPSTLDGVTLVTDDRILLKNQTIASENGCYIFSGVGSALIRSSDADTGSELVSATFPIRGGTVNQDTWWTVTNDTIILGTTSIVFSQTGGVGTYVNGTGLSLSGNVFSISNTYAGQTSITTLGTIGTGTWQGTAITDAYIASAATWNGKLSGTLTNTYVPISNGAGGLIDSNMVFSIASNRLHIPAPSSVASIGFGGTLATSNLELRFQGSASYLKTVSNNDLYLQSQSILLESTYAALLKNTTQNTFIGVQQDGYAITYANTQIFSSAGGTTQYARLTSSGFALGTSTINSLTQLDLQATNKGLGLNLVAGDLGTTRNGLIWYDTVGNSFKGVQNGSVVSFINNNGGTLTGALNEAPIVTVASASNVDIVNIAGNTAYITGTTGIATFTAGTSGMIRRVQFASALVLQGGNNIRLPNLAATITTTANDVGTFVYNSTASIWYCVSYTRGSASSLTTNRFTYFNGTDIVTTNHIIGNDGNNITWVNDAYQTFGSGLNYIRGGTTSGVELSSQADRKVQIMCGTTSRLRVEGNDILLGGVDHYFQNYAGTVQYGRLNTNGLLIGTGTINALTQLDLQSTTKGLGLNLIVGDLGTTRNGLVWYDTVGNLFKGVQNGSVVNLLTGSGLTTNNTLKWNGSQIVNANETDNGTTITSTLNRVFTGVSGNSNGTGVNSNKFLFDGNNTSASASGSFIQVAPQMQVSAGSIGGSLRGIVFLDGNANSYVNNGFNQLYINSGGDLVDSKITLRRAIYINHRSADTVNNGNANTSAVTIDATMFRPTISAVTRNGIGVHHITSVNADNYSSIIQAGASGSNPIHYSAYSQRDNAYAFSHYKDATINSGVLNHARNILVSNTTTFLNGFGFKTENYLFTSNASTIVQLDEEYIIQNVGAGTTTSGKRYRHIGTTNGVSTAYIMGLYAGGVIIGNTTALPNTLCSLDLDSATTGLGLNRVVGDLGTTRNGLIWYDTVANSFKGIANATVRTLAFAGDTYKFDEIMQLPDCNAAFATANTGVYMTFIPKGDIAVTKIYYNLQSAGTDTVRVAIYADGTNTPTTLIVQGSEAITGATTTGHRSVTVSSTNLTAGTRYWIAIKNDNGACSFLSRNNVYSNNITRESFTNGVFVASPAPSSSVNAVWLGLGV